MTDDELNEIEARQCAGDVPALVAELRRLRESSPAWHDRPTGPGLWFAPDNYRQRNLPIDEFDWTHQSDMLARWCGGRVFGPIPADEGTQA